MAGPVIQLTWRTDFNVDIRIKSKLELIDGFQSIWTEAEVKIVDSFGTGFASLSVVDEVSLFKSQSNLHPSFEILGKGHSY